MLQVGICNWRTFARSTRAKGRARAEDLENAVLYSVYRTKGIPGPALISSFSSAFGGSLQAVQTTAQSTDSFSL